MLQQVTDIMEAIKKKLAAIKEERNAAIERADNAEQEKRQANERAEKVITDFALGPTVACLFLGGGRREGGTTAGPRLFEL